ncbi:hypothetical protein SDD30_11950 [Moorella naiadis]|uniref:hypothetical protein n=1 Tax=Moorella naiadis (nom. illeg.) TaxID=3093670 RepID=UPI003D9CB513
MAYYSWLREKELPHLCCLVPVYADDGGNYTQVWMDDGRKIIERYRTKTLLRHIASYIGVDFKQKSAAWSDDRSRKAIPLIFGPNMTIVPLRVRKPSGRDAGSTGYVVREKVITWDAIDDHEFHTRIELEGGDHLLCLHKLDSLSNRLAEAERVRQRSRGIIAGTPSLAKTGGMTTIQIKNDTGEILVLP